MDFPAPQNIPGKVESLYNESGDNKFVLLREIVGVMVTTSRKEVVKSILKLGQIKRYNKILMH